MAEKVENKIDEIRSEEVQEILSAVPNWTIRWGISLILGLIVMLFFISWFIKYPDIAEGQVVLTTKTPPANLISQSNGYIEEIYLANESEVQIGEIVASIKNPIRKSSLDTVLDLLKERNKATLISQLQQIKRVGELQFEINNLINNLIESENLEEAEFYDKDIENIADQISHNERLEGITKQEMNLLKLELNNAKIKYEADSSLFADSIISKIEFYKNQSEYFNKKQQLISIKKTYVQYKISSSNLRQQKNDIQRGRLDLIRQVENNIESAKKNIKAFNDSWQESYILRAPQSGKIVYLSNLNQNDFVTAQQALFSVIPKNESYLAIMKLKDQAFGKIQKGQKVRMKFANYPYQEYGQLLGSVKEISSIPSEQGYFVKVNLTNGLTTTYQKTIRYQPEMLGSGEIITEDLRVLQRLFNNFKSLWDN